MVASLNLDVHVLGPRCVAIGGIGGECTNHDGGDGKAK